MFDRGQDLAKQTIQNLLQRSLQMARDLQAYKEQPVLNSSKPRINSTRCSQPSSRPSRLRSALAIAGLVGLSALPAAAAPVVFYDSYTLQTSDQSMWAEGTTSGWSYNSGFQGSSWGPTSNRLNAISGSPNAVIFPAVPSVCVWGVCTPGSPAVTADTRTGGAVTVRTSGSVGVAVNAQASGGAVSVVLPVSTQLQMSEAANGVFRIAGSSIVDGSAKITANAPSFKAGVDGIVNLQNSFTGVGCFIGAGCTASTSTANVNAGQFSIIGIDTDASKPISAFGVETPITKFGHEYVIRAGQTCVNGANDQGAVPSCSKIPFATPALSVVKPDNLSDFSGGTINNNVVSVSHIDPVLRMTADLTGILQSVLGFPADVLNPRVGFSLASVSGSLLNVQAGVTMGMSQEFELDPTLLVTLAFSKPVSEYDQSSGRWIDRGTTVLVDLTTGTELRYTKELGNLLSRTYSIKDEANFSSIASLSIDPTLPIRSGCFNLSVTGLGSTGTQCAFDQEFNTVNLLDVRVYDAEYSLRGFNQATFDVVIPVPEPSSVLLMVSALLGLGYVRRRRLQTSRSLSLSA